VPRPLARSYPKEKRWRFFQRQIQDAELLTFAQAIVASDEKPLAQQLPVLLRFLGTHTGTPSEMHGSWLATAENLMNQQGLGYTYNRGRFIRATDLSWFLQQTGDIASYYYYWSLRFQYPFTFPKHLHYVRNGVAVQPAVFLLQHLVQIFSTTSDLAQCYLSQDEITKYLMGSKSHAALTSNCTSILRNRTAGYNYSTERQNPAFIEAGSHFFSRGRLFLARNDLLHFEPGRVTVLDSNHLDRIRLFLTYAKPPVPFYENSEDARNHYFVEVFNELDPDPSSLYHGVNLLPATAPPLVPIRPSVRSRPAATTRPPALPANPPNLAGNFVPRTAPSRTFQAALRVDLLALYDRKCCICGLDREELLVTSHIVAVGVDPSIAADRRNCLLLCVLHDKAFDKGYYGFDDQSRLILNARLSGLSHPLLRSQITAKAGVTLPQPSDATLSPLPEYFRRHRMMNGMP